MNTSIDLNEIMKSTTELMTNLTANMDRRIGESHANVMYYQGDLIEIVIGYVNSEFVTKKDEKKVTKELLKQLKYKYSYKFKIIYSKKNSVDGNNPPEEKQSYQSKLSSPIYGIPDPINESLLRQLFDILLRGCENKSTEVAASRLIKNIYHNAGTPLKKIEFANEFMYLAWESIDSDEMRFPSDTRDIVVVNVGIQQFVSSVTLETAKRKKEYEEIHTLILRMLSAHDILSKVPFKNSDELKENLKISFEKEVDFSSLSDLGHMIKIADEVQTTLAKEYKDDLELEKIGKRTTERLYNLLDMMHLISKPEYFEHVMILIGRQWTFRTAEEGITWYRDNAIKLQQVIEEFKQAKSNINCLHKQIKKIKSLAEQRLPVVKIILNQQLELRREEMRQAKAQVQAEQVQTSADVLNLDSSPPVPVTTLFSRLTVNKTADVTKEVKQSAEQEAQRKEKKQASKCARSQQRTDSEPQLNKDIPDCYFTLQVTQVKTQEAFEIDVSSSRKIDEKSEYYPLGDYQYLIAKGCPIEEHLDERCRKKLIANQGRSLLSESSTGKPGVKFFNHQVKEPFAAIKGNEEMRILCVIKRLYIVRINREIELYIPTRLIANHKDYEKFINDANAPVMLRETLDNHLVIAEGDSSFMEEGIFQRPPSF